jgi:hypothetical protein
MKGAPDNHRRYPHGHAELAERTELPHAFALPFDPMPFPLDGSHAVHCDT